MKHYQRRQTESYPYFKLACWDSLSCTWRDGRVAFESQPEAAAAKKPGRYRLSEITDGGRRDLEPFEIPAGS